MPSESHTRQPVNLFRQNVVVASESHLLWFFLFLFSCVGEPEVFFFTVEGGGPEFGMPSEALAMTASQIFHLSFADGGPVKQAPPPS